MKDATLVEQALDGDSQAFHILITRYYTAIHNIILSWVRDSEDAKDLTQDVFISAYQNLPTLKRPESFYAWLQQIARRRCQNWQRNKQGNLIILQDNLISKEPPVDEVLILRETLAKVMEAIDNLPESERVLLKERYLDDSSYDELSARHGVSTKALVVRLVRTRRKIRNQLRKTLSAFVAFFHRHSEGILTGGVEAVKLSVKTKLIAGGVAAILILGGAGVLIRNQYMQDESDQIVSESPQESYPKMPAKSFSDAEKSSIRDNDYSNKKVATQTKSLVNESEMPKEKTENLQPEVASNASFKTKVPETKDSKIAISPELESAFKAYKGYVDKIRSLSAQSDPFDDRYGKLCQRDMELKDAINKATEEEEKNKLRKELQQIEKEKGEVAALKAPFLEARDRLTEEMDKYLQAHLGIAIMEFEEGACRGVYETWAKEQ